MKALYELMSKGQFIPSVTKRDVKVVGRDSTPNVMFNLERRDY